MYKVFINDRVLSFRTPAGNQEPLTPIDSHILKTLVDGMEQLPARDPVEVITEDPHYWWEKFKELHQPLEAAGGMVYNPEQELLMIYRLNHWDLPKGKLEEGEGAEEGALREVEEECGIAGLEITASLPTTYHTYRSGDQRILKKTNWFSMRSSYSGRLTPQLEEDITRVEWVSAENIPGKLMHTYESIRWLIQQTL